LHCAETVSTNFFVEEIARRNTRDVDIGRQEAGQTDGKGPADVRQKSRAAVAAICIAVQVAGS
jgi:hypothetical protein